MQNDRRMTSEMMLQAKKQPESDKNKRLKRGVRWDAGRVLKTADQHIVSAFHDGTWLLLPVEGPGSAWC